MDKRISDLTEQVNNQKAPLFERWGDLCEGISSNWDRNALDDSYLDVDRYSPRCEVRSCWSDCSR